MEQNIHPIIFVPGIRGTSLIDEYPITHEPVYSPVLDNRLGSFDPIMLDKTGEFDKHLDRLVGAHEIVRLVYGEMVNELRECLPLSGEEKVKAYIFPYDWRYPIVSNAERLKTFADYIIAKSRAHPMYQKVLKNQPDKTIKVNIVAHSMGGCVAKHYATMLGGEKNINQLVMLCAPLRGSLDAVKQLVMGDKWFFNFFTRKGKRKAARTFPGVYDLMPFDGYASGSVRTKWKNPAVTFPDGTAVDIYQTANWQENVIKKLGRDVLKLHLDHTYGFFNKAKEFSPKFRERVLHIYGTGEETLRDIRVSRTGDRKYDFEVKHGTCRCGDGVVPAISTYAEGVYCKAVTKKGLGGWDFNFGKLAGFHASICLYDKVQDHVLSFLRGKVPRFAKKAMGISTVDKMDRYPAPRAIDVLDEEPHE